MPSLLKIVFTAATSDAHKPLSVYESQYYLYAPESAEACPAYTTTAVDLHTSVTLPNGWYARLEGRVTDVGGAANCYVLPQIIHGTGSAVPIVISVVNAGGTERTPTADFYIGLLSFHKKKDVIGTFTGTWA